MGQQSDYNQRARTPNASLTIHSDSAPLAVTEDEELHANPCAGKAHRAENKTQTHVCYRLTF